LQQGDQSKWEPEEEGHYAFVDEVVENAYD